MSFDQAKSERNREERRFGFELAADFDFAAALIRIDDRKEYPETRYSALGMVGERVHVLVFAETNSGIRVISFRKANEREGNRYGQYKRV